LRSRVPAGLPGAARPEVLPVHRGLWCVAADVPLERYGAQELERRLRDMAWVADVALAHEAVVEHFARLKETTVVPMKLFTMFSARDRAIAELHTRRSELSEVVRRLRGCQEWGVRITRVPGTLVTRAHVRPPATGAAFLADKRRLRDDARNASARTRSAAEDAYRALAAVSRDSLRRDDMPAEAVAPPVLDAMFLVPMARQKRFRAAARSAEALCRAAGAQLTLTGPWPAYNFVQPST
jgi:gas vesicle protein GvpL/GvpF